jgi:hypothetical protein
MIERQPCQQAGPEDPTDHQAVGTEARVHGRRLPSGTTRSSAAERKAMTSASSSSRSLTLAQPVVFKQDDMVDSAC